jgi:hypothetical protein
VTAGASGSDQIAGRVALARARRRFLEFVIARARGTVVGDCQSPSGLEVDTSEDRMSQQTIKQQARRMARETAVKRRKEREERERRVIDLAERVMVAIGERDASVAETEKRAGEALRELTEREGLSLGEAVEWCGETITVRDATRLRKRASEPQADAARERGGGRDSVQAGDAAVCARAGIGGAGAG